MKWLDKWLARKVRNGLQLEKHLEEIKAVNHISNKMQIHTLSDVRISSGLDGPADLNFRMYKAENGWVMEVRQHDRRTDRQHTNLHLIADNEELGDSIAKIITLESLRAQ